jgi:hypothetical protein
LPGLEDQGKGEKGAAFSLLLTFQKCDSRKDSYQAKQQKRRWTHSPPLEADEEFGIDETKAQIGDFLTQDVRKSMV